MNKVSVELQHCYGIKKLSYEFDFTRSRAFAIYAPNGAMKSSFAETFKNLAAGEPSADRIFPTRMTVRKVTDENGGELVRDSVFVVLPYDAAFGHSAKTSTLLLDLSLKQEYEQLYAEIEEAKVVLVKALEQRSRSKKDVEQEITRVFSAPNFYIALQRIQKEVESEEPVFADVDYDRLFDDKVLAVLGTEDVKNALEEYIAKYDELLSCSLFFKKGIFDYYKAGQIAKTCAKNGFFEAKHSLFLNSREPLEIHTQQELEAVIEREKQAILTDKALRVKFEKITKSLDGNEAVRGFRDYVMAHPALLAQLTSVDQFKQSVWKSYIKAAFDSYVDLIAKHQNAQKRQREIESEAAKQRTQWEQVIRIFNERFFVPFKLEVKNKLAVIVGTEPIIDLGFTYQDGADSAPMQKEDLLRCLSTGEKRALYILNVIFEIEVRKKNKQETLMIVDDIADSFDYQNKYAIIQYLKDVHEDPLFKQIILTHNFDFFRTIERRFVRYDHCLMASKRSGAISIEKAEGINNVFVNKWKASFFDDDRMKIASIPFLRNLIEFTVGQNDPLFIRLTSLLHWKQDTASITEADLFGIYSSICKVGSPRAKGRVTAVVDIIKAEAEKCSKDADRLENKIVLAIAVRLSAEKFAASKINDTAFLAGLKSDQTGKLVERFRKQFPADVETLRVLDRVQLMTPENIHLNSFMYEPIIDMSGDALRALYAETLTLK